MFSVVPGGWFVVVVSVITVFGGWMYGEGDGKMVKKFCFLI